MAAGGRGRAEEIQRALRLAAEEAGRIDVLVNAAGFTRSVTTETPLAEAERLWNEVVDANLKGSFLASMAAAPLMARPGGRIVNVSSIAAFMGGSGPGALAYASAKAGVLGLTYALARELSPQGITVNAVAQGIVAGMGFFEGPLPEEYLEVTVARTPAGRAGRPEDVAAAVLYLTSLEASFVTGEVLNVNGG